MSCTSYAWARFFMDVGTSTLGVLIGLGLLTLIRKGRGWIASD